MIPQVSVIFLNHYVRIALNEFAESFLYPFCYGMRRVVLALKRDILGELLVCIKFPCKNNTVQLTIATRDVSVMELPSYWRETSASKHLNVHCKHFKRTLTIMDLLVWEPN